MKKIFVLILSLVCLGVGISRAQLKKLYTFPHGSNSTETLALLGNKLYGTDIIGGLHDSGCVFSIDTDGTGYTDLHDFAGPDGLGPIGSLLLSGSILYGMTAEGGVHDSGTIFSIRTDGTGFKKLFDYSGPDGKVPFGPSLRLMGGTLYGMASYGGVLGQGCIFSIDTNGAGYNDLHDFATPKGARPFGSLVILRIPYLGQPHLVEQVIPVVFFPCT